MFRASLELIGIKATKAIMMVINDAVNGNPKKIFETIKAATPTITVNP